MKGLRPASVSMGGLPTGRNLAGMLLDNLYSNVKQKVDTFIKLVLVCEVYGQLYTVFFYKKQLEETTSAQRISAFRNELYQFCLGQRLFYYY